MSYGRRLRALLESDGIVVSPGVHDPLSARVAEEVGFDLVAMTGNGTSLAKVGQPDVGVLTLTEMVENAKYIQQAVDVPIISDADNGFGNAVNVTRTVREFAAAGVGAIHIEDQVFPKRCGFVEGKRVVSKEEAVGKFRAAADIRDECGSEMVLIARTDARGAPEGTLDDAIDRVNAYCEAGADVAFVQGAKDVDELERVAREVDAPLLYNCSGGSPVVSIERADELGYDVVIFPRLSTLPTITALFERFGQLRAEGMDAWTETKEAFEGVPVESYDHFSGVPQVLEWEEEYLPEE
ncbi:carboxyvinyl-carboxyphosphonate phosphorylmutase [Salinigranum rubrum]|uniref:Carboxyvinyl-carboxyphosphonate phosphorylmutase n=1 Tax=Salinigranum rubrum TaxID=755307 RepID=A0A2I8VIC0_9EURY|nr:isocitrate lyase/PEP mutase family protein [Salinigranum rubrum]AUV80799.1 carboxyvinyl-carboxyphosphonate phosphorylmutase [Salinigranum rubrum]